MFEKKSRIEKMIDFAKVVKIWAKYSIKDLVNREEDGWEDE